MKLQQVATPSLHPPADPAKKANIIFYTKLFSHSDSTRKFIWISEKNHAIMKHVKTEGNENKIPKMKGEEIWEEQLQ